MKVSQIRHFLVQAFNAQPKPSILLLGPPGVGKSDAVREAAEELAKRLGKVFVDYDDDRADEILSNPDRFFVFVDLRLTEVEPSDLIGVPRDDDGQVRYKPLLWARVLNKAAGLLFLDELTNVQRQDIQAAAYKLIRDRKAGFTRFNDDILVVAAGNSPEHSSVANMLPAPLVNRLLVIDVSIPTVREWTVWMDQHFKKWDRRVIAYLTQFPDDFLKVPNDPETLTNFPTPRSWTSFAVAVTQFDGDDLAPGFLGGEVGQRVKAYLEVQPPPPEELIKTPQRWSELDLDVKYISCVSLASHLVKLKDLKQASPLLEAIANDSQEFVVLIALAANNFKLLQRLLQLGGGVRSALAEVAKFKAEAGI